MAQGAAEWCVGVARRARRFALFLRNHAAIDASLNARYSESSGKRLAKVAVRSIQLGQVWRGEADGQDYLVTKLYNEVFTQYAMLRPAGIVAPDAPLVRVKVTQGSQGASLPGYTFTQEGSF